MTNKPNPEPDLTHNFTMLVLIISLISAGWFLFFYESAAYSPGEGNVVNIELCFNRLCYLVASSAVALGCILILCTHRLAKLLAANHENKDHPHPGL